MSNKETYESFANSGIYWINWIYDKAVNFLFFFSKATGISYEEINVWLFVIIGPLILISSIILNIYLIKKLNKK